MVLVKPLKGIFYNKNIVDINEVIAPPYDVIDKKHQQKLYERNPYNVVRLILNKDNNPYQSAKAYFNEWLSQKILIQHEKPCMLYLIQKYKNNRGNTIERKGFIARNKIEDFSTKNILPHEYTMGGPKQDRLNLVTETGAFFSQIFMVYNDKEQIIENKIVNKYIEKEPFIKVSDELGIENIAYIIDDEADLEIISNTLKDKTLLIADGHHRYETAMNYSKLHPENEYAKYVMSYFTNAADENLVIYPTHRIVEKDFSNDEILNKVSKYYDIETLNDKESLLEKIEIENKKQITTGLILRENKNFYLLKLKPNIKETIDAPGVLQNLDLTILHELILKNELGYTQEQLMAQDKIKFEKQETVAFDSINNTASACFIMAYPKMADVLNVSKQGYRMPQKSTYFYPKLLSGLIINQINKGE